MAMYQKVENKLDYCFVFVLVSVVSFQGSSYVSVINGKGAREVAEAITVLVSHCFGLAYMYGSVCTWYNLEVNQVGR